MGTRKIFDLLNFPIDILEKMILQSDTQNCFIILFKNCFQNQEALINIFEIPTNAALTFNFGVEFCLTFKNILFMLSKDSD